jgi:hypothetical protein
MLDSRAVDNARVDEAGQELEMAQSSRHRHGKEGSNCEICDADPFEYIFEYIFEYLNTLTSRHQLCKVLAHEPSSHLRRVQQH